MNFIFINNLSFSYKTSQVSLFENFDLKIQEKWTVIAGSNGCGKSTLLKLIAGLEAPDSGKIQLDGEIIYCPQETKDIPQNIYTSFWSPENDIRKFFSILKITEDMIERYETLSGGEKKRIQIACALAEKPSLLLLDEPTNHLDKKTVQLILSALKNFEGMGLIVSHDRYFTDQLCTKTVYLSRESKDFAGGRDIIVAQTYNCGLSEAIKRRQEASEISRNKWNTLDSKMESEKKRSQKLQEENSRSREKLSKKTLDSKDHDMKHKLDCYRLSGADRNSGDAKARLDTQISHTQQQRDSVNKTLMRKEGFSVLEIENNKSIIVEKTELVAGTYKLSIPHVEFAPGEKIALTGENGTGKSLFIKHIIDILKKENKQSQIMYLPQEISNEQQSSVLQEYAALKNDEKGAVLSTLYRLGSEPESLFGDYDGEQSVSPGELRKLMISMAILKPLSLLILDEPTNHMDITSVLALENALSQIKCGLLVISHDEAFLEKITTRKISAVRKNDTEGCISL